LPRSPSPRSSCADPFTAWSTCYSRSAPSSSPAWAPACWPDRTGRILTGVVGFFVVVACAATLHRSGVHVDDAAAAARALQPVAGALSSELFAVGFLGAGLLAVAVVPMSTAYSVAEAFDRPADLDRPLGEARLFYGAYAVALTVACAVVLVPGMPLIRLLYLSQAPNAVLLLAILPALRGLARDPRVMGDERLGPWSSAATAVVMVLVACSVVALVVLELT
jgi:Mn2+/Fe2+ NRAMP family transporter